MAAGLLPSLREYTMRYGLTLETLRWARPDALVLHPGPMNEGVEISPEVAALDRAVITTQVANGVAVRMAVLYLLAGSGPIEETGERRGGAVHVGAAPARDTQTVGETPPGPRRHEGVEEIVRG